MESASTPKKKFWLKKKPASWTNRRWWGYLRSRTKKYQNPRYINVALYKQPRTLTTVKIDGEDVLIGPILFAILQEKKIPLLHVVYRTGLDHRTLRDALHGKNTPRMRLGPVAISQIMQYAKIDIQDIVAKHRELRSALDDQNLP